MNSSNVNDIKFHSKMGRKGDPRMHRAVAARLANPDLTLFEALRTGGFDYPTNDDASVMDSEKVTLGQRKNQLSRRLRQARKNHKSNDTQDLKLKPYTNITSGVGAFDNGRHQAGRTMHIDETVDSSECSSSSNAAAKASVADDHHSVSASEVHIGRGKSRNSGVANAAKSREPQNELEKLLQRSQNAKISSSPLIEHLRRDNLSVLGTTSVSQPRKRAMVSEIDLSDDGLISGNTERLESPLGQRNGSVVPTKEREDPSKRARMAKFHPDYTPIFVPPSASVRNSLTGMASRQHRINQEQQQQQQQQETQQQHLDPDEQQQHPMNKEKQPQQQPNPFLSQQAQKHLPQTDPNAFMSGGLGRESVGASMSPYSMSAAAAAAAFTLGSFGTTMAAPSAFGSPFLSLGTSMFPASTAGGSRPSAVAVASLSATANAVGLTLEQLAISLASSPSNLAKVLAECCSTTSDSALAKQMQLALHLHQTESRVLYTKCMLSVGIDPTYCQENNPTHLKFALDAWQKEGKRLHALMGQRTTRSLSPEVGDDVDTKESPLDDGSTHSSYNSHSSTHTRETDNQATAATNSAKSDAENMAKAYHEHSSDTSGCYDHQVSDTNCNSASSQKGGSGICGSIKHSNVAYNGEARKCSRNTGRHVHRLEGKCGHKAIVHIPKDGSAHIDFVIGNKVECYHGIEPLGKNANSMWPSKFKCSDLEGSCSRDCAVGELESAESDKDKPTPVPKIINLSEISLADPEWNVDLNGSIDGSLMGLFKLGERGDDSVASI